MLPLGIGSNKHELVFDTTLLSTMSRKNLKISQSYVAFHLATEKSQLFSTQQVIGIVKMMVAFKPHKLDSLCSLI